MTCLKISARNNRANEFAKRWRLLEKYLVLISIDAIARLVSLRRTLLVAVGVKTPNNAMKKL
jgi:hypothetical protein